MKNKKILVSAVFSMLITATLLGIASFKYAEKNEISNTKPVISKVIAPVTYNNYLTEKGYDLIENKLLVPLRKKLKTKANAKMYSRCPSGLQHYVSAEPSEDAPYFLCTMENYNGCNGQKVCDFRVSASEENIEIYDEKLKSFVSADVWLGKQTNETLAHQEKVKKSTKN